MRVTLYVYKVMFNVDNDIFYCLLKIESNESVEAAQSTQNEENFLEGLARNDIDAFMQRMLYP